MTQASQQETQEMWVRSRGREDSLKKKMTTHSSILAWKIPWTEDSGVLKPNESQWVGHDWMTKHSTVWPTIPLLGIQPRKNYPQKHQFKKIHASPVSWQHHLQIAKIWKLEIDKEDVIYIYAAAAAAKSLQSCPTLCDPIDGSPPGSAVPGILLQARTLE